MTSFFTDTRQHEVLADAILDTLFCEGQHTTTVYNYQAQYRAYRAAFIKHDAALLSLLRKKLRCKLVEICTQLNTISRGSPGPLNRPTPQSTLETVLAYSLCFLAHTGIKQSDEPYLIPVCNQQTQVWTQRLYRVECIELTPNSGWEAFVMTPHDRVFAYGLIPVDQRASVPSSPILIFPGKPVFTGQGFTTWWFDQFQWPFTPNSWLLYTGKSALTQWLKHHAHSAKASVYGLAAGASLACELFFDNEIKPYIKEVIAYDPDKLYKSSPRAETASEERQPSVLIITTQSPHTAPIPGAFATQMSSSQIWQLKPLTISQQWHPIPPCYAAKADVPVEELDPTPPAPLYYRLWYLRLLVSELLQGLAFTLFILPCRFLILPTVRAILEHKTEALILSMLIFAFIVLPGVCVTPLGIAGAITASLYLLYKLTPALERLLGFQFLNEAKNENSISQIQFLA